MSKIMLVNVIHPEESRVAVLDDGVLDAYEIETINRTHIKGNIYNAVVESVHASLEAAFVKIAPDQKGFLPLDEVNFKLLPARGDGGRGGKIGRHLHPGQKLMAQVVREPFSGKPATISTYFSLPGRYLVLMPGVDSAGVSRKIQDAEQRERLKGIVADLRLPEGFGVIVRTAGLGQTKQELQRDLRYLLRLWQSIQRASQATEFPAPVYQEADLVIRTIRDYFTPDVNEVWIDSGEVHERALGFVRDVMPTKAKTMRLYTGDRPLFNKFNLEEQIESIYKRRVTLPSGGEIVIDGTEALTAIDVNSARSKKQGDAEDNATQTNLEASKEIARQLRLRDLGGLIVIDFIDMSAARNIKRVEKTLRDAMRGDKARYDATRISKLGLLEIARQRIKSAKVGAMYNSCPTCEGYGLIKNVEAAALAALRKLQTRITRGDIGRLQMKLPTEVAGWMLNHKREELLQVERRHRVRVEIEARSDLLRHANVMETSPREASEEPPPAVVHDRVVALPPAEPQTRVEDEPNQGGEGARGGTTNGEAPRRRSRRRRRPAGAPDTPRPTAETGAEPAPPERADGGEKLRAESEPPAEKTAEPGGDAAVRAEGDERDQDSAEVRSRRRRKRRRRPRSSPQDAESPAPPERRPEREERIVPRDVRADELMPAAVGSAAARRKRSAGTKSAPRRRRKTSGR